jgi:hypothetical protein
MLEHLGVEQDYGCRALSNVPRRFEGDAEVLPACLPACSTASTTTHMVAAPLAYGCSLLHCMLHVHMAYGVWLQVLRAFKGFQTGCVVSLKKAAGEREAIAAAAKGVSELSVASHDHGHHHPVNTGKGCGDEGCQHDHNH